MFAEYEAGRTPNPDVLCNREIKFDVFLKEALKLGAERVATGHYCRREEWTDNKGVTHYQLLAGSDGNKDQSYFLCQLSEEQLSRALFPVGDMLKPEVRAVATEHHLATAKRKDSQGICFVGKVDLPVFLQQKLAAKKGRIVEVDASWEGYRTAEQESELIQREDVEALSRPYVYEPSNGRKVGTHTGAHFYTIGQRHGLGVGGTALPLFVIATDVVRNIVYVGQGHTHPGLLRSALHIRPEEMHWVRESTRMMPGDEPREYMVRIRYRQPLQSARLFVTDNGGYLLFDEPQRGVTAGQFAAWYDGDELVGSGVIAE
jgi:tRNA-specific 2-thiouridylase